METISFDEFKKIDLRVGKIISAKPLEQSEKLLLLEVDIGEIRQIIAGIGKNYTPEEIIGKQIVIVANLEPRQLLGFESQGMLLAADAEGPVLLGSWKEVLPGTRIR